MGRGIDAVRLCLGMVMLTGALVAACAHSSAPREPVSTDGSSAAPVAVSQEPIPPFTEAVAQSLGDSVRQVLASHTFSVPVAAREPVLRIIHHLQHDSDAHLVVAAGLSQAPAYREQIVKSLVRDGLPAELFFIAEAESAFLDPALQGKGLAVGLWQMIPSTARHYGLRVDDNTDERTDVFKSTDASLRHLVDLHHTFGDWELAITGFYAGAGIVEHALEVSGAKDAWVLIEHPDALPQETRGYLPLVYAHAIISSDPTRFGFSTQVSDADLARLRSSYGHFYTNRYPADLFAR